ncbi:MAG TPA: amylo-alpha-1,6-glucosidase [Gammaproteobacteria bacterium]|nr:amylo-alpha-1,6-glucosidase [Gammaproteobacteria bacterium]
MAAPKDVIQIDDRWYVLATSSRTDDRTRVLKHDDLFGLFDRWGDVQHIGLGEQGLYFQGTRFLSRLELTVNQRRPLLLNSTVQEDNALMVVDLTLPDLYDNGVLAIRKGTVHLFRSKLLWQGQCYEHFCLHNYSDAEVRMELELVFEADYSDIFEVRGAARVRSGAGLSAETEGEKLTLAYRGLDGVLRRTRIRLTPAPRWEEGGRARMDCCLPPGGGQDFYLTITCDSGVQAASVVRYDEALRAHRALLRKRREAAAEVFTSNEQFNDWLNRSAADLHMLTTDTPEGPYPYAGTPWFSTPFGRDALITALQTLWLNPALARGVLAFLAHHQAEEEDPASDAEPGKILHEMRGGEMAALGEVPFARYYGSVDATPLFVWLAGAYYRRSGDRALIEAIWPNIRRALEWIDHYGDADGDGFVEYTRHSANGLVQQGWKDSDDSVFHADGSAADGPIALCEVQAYVYEAKREAAALARLLGEERFAADLEAQAVALQRRFNAVFWCEEIQTYALALDGAKRPCRVRSSNAGHVLATGIADPVRGRQVAQSLLAPASFSGWGVRTIAAGEARYNPMSYHNGSVWPHDSALVAAGVARYGNKEDVLKILTGLFDASITLDLHRLPELFCGFDRLRGQGPTLYPVACLPQAWASGAVFHLLQSCLGLVFSPEKPQLRFYHPKLPDYLDRIKITRLRFNSGVIDLVFRRHPRDVGINVLRKEGDVEIAVIV